MKLKFAVCALILFFAFAACFALLGFKAVFPRSLFISPHCARNAAKFPLFFASLRFNRKSSG